MSVQDIGSSLLAEQSVYARLVVKRQRATVTPRQRSGDCHFTQQNPMKNLTPNQTDDYSIVNLPPLMTRLPENSIFDRIPYIDGPDFRFVNIDGSETDRQLTMNRLPATGQLQMLDLSPSLPQVLRGESIFDEGYCERARTAASQAGNANPSDATGPGDPSTMETGDGVSFEAGAAAAGNMAVAEAGAVYGSKFSSLTKGQFKVSDLFPNLLPRVVQLLPRDQVSLTADRDSLLANIIGGSNINMQQAAAYFNNTAPMMNDVNMRLEMLKYVVYGLSSSQVLRLGPELYAGINGIITDEMNNFNPASSSPL